MVVILKVVQSILGYLAEKEVAMPIQVERDLKISRYLVFGSLIIMEELGLVEAIAKRANWKLYRITGELASRYGMAITSGISRRGSSLLSIHVHTPRSSPSSS